MLMHTTIKHTEIAGIFPNIKLPPWWAVPVPAVITGIFGKHPEPPRAVPQKKTTKCLTPKN